VTGVRIVVGLSIVRNATAVPNVPIAKNVTDVLIAVNVKELKIV